MRAQTIVILTYVSLANPCAERNAFELARVPDSSGNTRKCDPAALKDAGPTSTFACSSPACMVAIVPHGNATASPMAMDDGIGILLLFGSVENRVGNRHFKG